MKNEAYKLAATEYCNGYSDAVKDIEVVLLDPITINALAEADADFSMIRNILKNVIKRVKGV